MKKVIDEQNVVQSFVKLSDDGEILHLSDELFENLFLRKDTIRYVGFPEENYKNYMFLVSVLEDGTKLKYELAYKTIEIAVKVHDEIIEQLK